ncbi:hypothetical protein WJX81_001512 [Elliptochloris bilobata]|uniref:Enoyl reductase (ER) domain-containing protein n=1 Tax=Elliptochloris bilobata TaxID=381761 RepID=A0AAW1QCK4_9CHLO
MKALICKQLGHPLATDDKKPLKLVQNHPQPSPSLPANGVRIRVTAAALNFSDALQIQGLYQDRPKLPFVPGSEVSGVVIEVGRDVRTVQVGDAVCAVMRGGGFAEEVVVRDGAALKLPAGTDVAAAAGLPLAFGTSHVALAERANLQPGQTVLVLGAAGGVGIAAVQIAKVMGARVVAVCRGSAKAAALRALGADAVVDTAAAGKDVPLRQLIKAAAPQGIDVVYDPVGGVAFMESLKTINWGAQILIIGFASGTIPKISSNIALVKNATLHGVFWGSYMQHRPRVLRQSLEQLLAWLGEGRISIPIFHRRALFALASSAPLVASKPYWP